MKLNSNKQKVIKVDDQKFTKAMETQDHIYFVDESEGDENANTIMFDKETLDLVSNNYFANQSLMEDIWDDKATKIEKSFQYNYNEVMKNKDLD